MTKLCVVDITCRLGMMAAGVEEIKSQPFFTDTDWPGLLEKRVSPPKAPVAVTSKSSFNNAKAEAEKAIKLPETTPADIPDPEDAEFFHGY